MPHRGRLNVLANVMRKPMEEMLYEFMEGTISADSEGQVRDTPPSVFAP
jgi:2-oxoglutarate dehydrogenase complex dehydrogenase (E1) component-like enzyme